MSIVQNRRVKASLAAITISALALAFSACGSDSLSQPNTSSAVAVTANPALNAMLPDKIKKAGIIQVGVDASYKPNEYLNGTTVVGWDVELFDAVAAKLGVKTKWNPGYFDTMLANVQGGKYDIGVSSFTISPERLKKNTMVSYANVGTWWLTLAGNPKAVNKDNPCGKTVAVQKGTVQDDELASINAGKCASNPVKVLPYSGQDEVTNAVYIGKADAMLADYPVIQSAVTTSQGKMAPLGEEYGRAYYGYVLTPNNQQFAKAIAAALTELKKEGVYGQIMTKYGIQSDEISEFQVNPKQ